MSDRAARTHQSLRGPGLRVAKKLPRERVPWLYYEGLFLFLNGTPRQVFAVRVLPNGAAAAVCH